MKHRLFHLLAAVCILLSIVCIVEWLNDARVPFRLVPSADVPPGLTWDRPVHRYFGFLVYEIAGNTIQLNYANGVRASLTFFPEPSEHGQQPPGMIWLDGKPFLLK